MLPPARFDPGKESWLVAVRRYMFLLASCGREVRLAHRVKKQLLRGGSPTLSYLASSVGLPMSLPNSWELEDCDMRGSIKRDAFNIFTNAFIYIYIYIYMHISPKQRLRLRGSYFAYSS